MSINFNDYIEQICNVTTSDFTDAKKLILANYIYRELCADINEVDPTRFQRTSYFDFIPTSTKDGADHSLPLTSGVSDLVSGQVLEIWVTYDGSTWYPVEFYPKTQIDFNNTYSTASPVGWWEGNNFKVLPQPTATVTNGGKITFSNRATDLTAITTDPIAIDKEFWGLIPIGVSYRFLESKGQYNQADRYKQEYMQGRLEMKRKISDRGNQKKGFTLVENLTEEYS